MSIKIPALVTYGEDGKTHKREKIELRLCWSANPVVLEINLPTKWKTKYQSIYITRRRLLRLLNER